MCTHTISLMHAHSQLYRIKYTTCIWIILRVSKKYLLNLSVELIMNRKKLSVFNSDKNSCKLHSTVICSSYILVDLLLTTTLQDHTALHYHYVFYIWRNQTAERVYVLFKIIQRIEDWTGKSLLKSSPQENLLLLSFNDIPYHWLCFSFVPGTLIYDILWTPP